MRGHESRRVLAGVSAAFAPGQLTAVVGPNGCGKSTLLRLLLGTLSPEAGSVTIDGEPTARLRGAARARRLAFVPQKPEVWAAFTVREVVALGRRVFDHRPEAVDAALAAMDLSDRGGEVFGTLSAGQQQRAAVARALAQLADDPPSGLTRALLADEPVSAQDPRHALAVMTALRSQSRRAAGGGLAVVVVLHDLSIAAVFADRVLLLDQSGQVAAAGEPASVFSGEGGALERVFGVGFERLASAAGPVLVPRGEPARRPA